jgi:glycosyltransferase involved in cell wall biosynthesis
MALVSVIVPTYNTGDALHGVVKALDAQSLPQSDFEVIVVDDGSTDDTFHRAVEMAATRPNYVVERIEHSGWPGRPRNVGTRLAKGDFLFFMDHDDYIFPEALARMAQFASDGGLDVVMSKEVVSGLRAPVWSSWRSHQQQNAVLDQAVLQCLTPHKLYRRHFVLERGIRFPEGRIRLEDFAYNAQVLSQTDNIGVLADYPCYRWNIHPTNSHKGVYDIDVYWRSVENSLQPILENLGPSLKRDELLARWYRGRILDRLNSKFAGYSREYREHLESVLSGLLHYFPQSVDRLLTPADLARSALLRAGHFDALLTLSQWDKGLELRCYRTAAAWLEGFLRISVEGTIVTSDGSPMLFRRTGGAVSRVVPDQLANSSAADIDVLPALASAIGELVIRARTSDVDWPIDSRTSFDFVDSGEYVQFRFATVGELDPAAAAGGRALDPDVWDVFLRLDGLGYTGTTRVPAHEVDGRTAIVQRHAAMAYKTNAGLLALVTYRTAAARDNLPDKAARFTGDEACT